MSLPNETPLDVAVTALLVTLPVPERLAFAKRSIDDFCRQTLTNKTLLVVINGGVEEVRQALRGHVAGLNRSNIQILEPPGVLNLGQLRNLSYEAATTELVCQWDDDDLAHPERLETQARTLIDNDFEGVYLQEVMHYFPEAQKLYCTNWRATAAHGHPGTLMSRRALGLHYPSEGEVAVRGEDSVLAEALMARGKVGYVTGQPHLYVYVTHGANTWNESHHAMLRDELAISQGLLKRREAQIRNGLEPYGLPPGTSVEGSNGEAFRL